MSVAKAPVARLFGDRPVAATKPVVAPTPVAAAKPVVAPTPVAAAKPVVAPTPVAAAKPVVAPVPAPATVEVKVQPIVTPLVAAPVEAIASTVAPKAAALRQAMGEAVTASAHGALAVNDKVIEALQTQSHAALDLWRNAVSTPHLSDVLRLQSNGARQAYETASAQWKDIAETTAHWFTKTVEPLSSAMSDLKR